MLKKIIFAFILIISLVGGGYFFYSYYLNNSTTHTFGKDQEQEKDWRNLHLGFKKEPRLINSWKERGFTYAQTKMWIDINSKPSEADFCAWLRDEGYTPDSVLNYGNNDELLKDYEIWKKQKISLKERILSGLYEWLLTDFPTGKKVQVEDEEYKNALEKTISELKNNSLDENTQLNSFRSLLNNWVQYLAEEDNGIFIDQTLKELTPNYQKLLEYLEEWEDKLDQGSFALNKNLTAEEINWATGRINHNLPIKILPAEWFSNKIVSLKQNSSVLSEIINQIQTKDELIFIPVQGLKYWSLLILEDNFFYKFDFDDSMGNYDFTEPALKLIIEKMNEIRRQTGNISDNYWELYIRKNNQFSLVDEDNNFDSSKSGIMIISIIQQIIQLYSSRFRLVSEKVEMNGTMYTRPKVFLKDVVKSMDKVDLEELRKELEGLYK